MIAWISFKHIFLQLGNSWTAISGYPVCYLNSAAGPSTHWGRVTHICVGELTIIGSDNGLSPERRQAIIWTNAGILLIRPLGTNFSEILIEIHSFSFRKMRLKVSSAKWRPFCLGLNGLRGTRVLRVPHILDRYEMVLFGSIHKACFGWGEHWV